MKRYAKRKSVSPSKLVRAKKGEDIHYQNFKISSKLIPTQAVTQSNYMKYMFSPFSVEGSFLLRDLAEFRVFTNMYDRYRITGVNVRVIPRITQTTQQVIGGNDNDGTGVFYTAIDRDSVCPSSINAMKRYKSCRVHKQTASMTRGYNVKYPKEFWMDTRLDVNPGESSPFYTNARQIGLTGGITLYGENFTERSGQVLNYVFADVEVTYKCVFQTYNPQGLSLDGETGEVTISAQTDEDDATKVIQQLVLNDGDLTGLDPDE